MTVNFAISKDLAVIAPLFVLFLSSLVPITIKAIRRNKDIRPLSTLLWGVIGLLGAAGTTAAVVSNMLKMSERAVLTVFSDLIVLDGAGIWALYLLFFLGLVALLLSYDHVAIKGRQYPEFVFLLLNSIIGAALVAMSADLLMSFIAIELMSLTLYLLIAISHERTLSKEAAFKYFILGSFASAILLFGISFVYGSVGSTNLTDITSVALDLFTGSPLFVVGFLLVVLGFAFKVSVFPLHAWTPDVYQGASTPVTTLMPTAIKMVSFIAFMRLFAGSNFFRLDTPSFSQVIQWLAILTMTVGNVAALLQNNLKRMLAYSSVAHSGYMMVGLIAAGLGSNFDSGASGLMFYLLTYSIMTVGTFALVALFERQAETAVYVDDLKGLSRRSPVMAFSFFILLLSLAGLPPTLGFFGKFYLFSAAIDQGFIWLAVWGVLNSVISVYYYLRPIVLMYMSVEEGPSTQRLVFTQSTLLISAIAVVVLGIASGPLFRLVQKSLFMGM